MRRTGSAGAPVFPDVWKGSAFVVCAQCLGGAQTVRRAVLLLLPAPVRPTPREGELDFTIRPRSGISFRRPVPAGGEAAIFSAVFQTSYFPEAGCSAAVYHSFGCHFSCFLSFLCWHGRCILQPFPNFRGPLLGESREFR